MDDRPAKPALSRLWRASRRNRFATLLAALLTMFAAVAAVFMIEGPAPRFAAGFVVAVLFNLVLLSAIDAVARNRATLKIAVWLALPAMIAGLASAAIRARWLIVAGNLLSIAFVGYVIAMILGFLFRNRRVDMNVVCASLCVYLLIGTLWSSVYTLCDVLQSKAFVYAYTDRLEHPEMVFGAESSLTPLYYSMVTLTTLGYGDIVPFSPPAKILAVLEAIVGQFYLTVLVARLVGLHIAHASRRA